MFAAWRWAARADLAVVLGGLAPALQSADSVSSFFLVLAGGGAGRGRPGAPAAAALRGHQAPLPAGVYRLVETTQAGC